MAYVRIAGLIGLSGGYRSPLPNSRAQKDGFS